MRPAIWPPGSASPLAEPACRAFETTRAKNMLLDDGEARAGAAPVDEMVEESGTRVVDIVDTR